MKVFGAWWPGSLESEAVQRYLLIVSRREDPLVYATLNPAFAHFHDVDVILDRRRRERRWQTIPTEVNRRARERRAANIDALLRQLGWVVVQRRTEET